MTDERIADLMGWTKPCAGGYSHGPADMLARIKRVVAEAETSEREACIVIASAYESEDAQEIVAAMEKRSNALVQASGATTINDGDGGRSASPATEG